MREKNLMQKLISFMTEEIMSKYGGFCPDCGIRLFFVKGRFCCPYCDFNKEEQKVEMENDA